MTANKENTKESEEGKHKGMHLEGNSMRARKEHSPAVEKLQGNGTGKRGNGSS
jgi:hypothetical protein